MKRKNKIYRDCPYCKGTGIQQRHGSSKSCLRCGNSNTPGYIQLDNDKVDTGERTKVIKDIYHEDKKKYTVR